MERLDEDARRFQYAAYVLVALVTMAWMAAIGFGWSVAASTDAEFARDTAAILTPGLMGLAMAAIGAVVLTLLAITRRLELRGEAMAEAPPQLLGRR